jgi:hypothetical protein
MPDLFKEVSKKSSSWRRGGISSVQEVLKSLCSRHRGLENFQLIDLWESWPDVVGPELRSLAHPLGARKQLLIIGAEDNLVLHELRFYAPQILERVNYFLKEKGGGEYAGFTQIRLELLQDRPSLYAAAARAKAARPESAPAPCRPKKTTRPDNLGSLLSQVDPESAFGRAYLNYVKFFRET